MVQSDMIAYYTFNPDSPLSDLSGVSGSLTDGTGTSNPTTYQASGPWPGAYSAVFSGSNYLQLPSLNLGKMSANLGFSVCTWFQFTELNDVASRVFDFAADPSYQGPSGAAYNFILQYGSNGDLLLQHYDTWNSANNLDLPNPILSNEWRHICITNKGLSLKVYDNGRLAVSVTTAKFQDVLLTSNFLGKSHWASNPMLRGAIDDFRVYSTELPADEVSKVYSLAPGMFQQ